MCLLKGNWSNSGRKKIMEILTTNFELLIIIKYWIIFWQNCWQIMLTKNIDKECWQKMVKKLRKHFSSHLGCKWLQSPPRGCTKGRRGNRFASHSDGRFSSELLWRLNYSFYFVVVKFAFYSQFFCLTLRWEVFLRTSLTVELLLSLRILMLLKL